MTDKPVTVTHTDKALALAIMIEFNGDREKLPLLEEWMAKTRLETRTAHAPSQPTAGNDYEQYRSALQAMMDSYNHGSYDISMPADELDQSHIHAGLAFAAAMPSQHGELADSIAALVGGADNCALWRMRGQIIAALRQTPQDTARQPSPGLVNEKLGFWLSASIDDPNSCDEFKQDVRNWFKATFRYRPEGC